MKSLAAFVFIACAIAAGVQACSHCAQNSDGEKTCFDMEGVLSMWDFRETEGTRVNDQVGTHPLDYRNNMDYNCTEAFTHLEQGLHMQEWNHYCAVCTAVTLDWAAGVAETQEYTFEFFIRIIDSAPAGTWTSDSRRIWAWAQDGGSGINSMIGQNVRGSPKDMDIRTKVTNSELRFDDMTWFASNVDFGGSTARLIDEVVHLVMTFKEGRREVYVNGRLLGAVFDDMGPFFPTAEPFCIFNHWDVVRPWAGTMYLGAMYNKALDHATIQAHSDAGYNVYPAASESECPIPASPEEPEAEAPVSGLTSFLFGVGTSVAVILVAAVLSSVLSDKKKPAHMQANSHPPPMAWDSASQMSGSQGSLARSANASRYDDMQSTSTRAMSVVPDIPEDESPYLE